MSDDNRYIAQKDYMNDLYIKEQIKKPIDLIAVMHNLDTHSIIGNLIDNAIVPILVEDISK